MVRSIASTKEGCIFDSLSSVELGCSLCLCEFPLGVLISPPSKSVQFRLIHSGGVAKAAAAQD